MEKGDNQKGIPPDQTQYFSQLNRSGEVESPQTRTDETRMMQTTPSPVRAPERLLRPFQIKEPSSLERTISWVNAHPRLGTLLYWLLMFLAGAGLFALALGLILLLA